MTRRLTAEAQADRDDFKHHVREFGGCACFISAPCGHCTHPGNPHNQEEDDCYVPKTASRNQREGTYAERCMWRSA